MRLSRQIILEGLTQIRLLGELTDDELPVLRAIKLPLSSPSLALLRAQQPAYNVGRDLQACVT
jgi:hypothetical protein